MAQGWDASEEEVPGFPAQGWKGFAEGLNLKSGSRHVCMGLSSFSGPVDEYMEGDEPLSCIWLV